MRTQDSRRLRTGWPPLETALRQSFRGEPEPLAVIGQQFYSCPPTAAEDEQTAGKRIRVQLLPAKLCDGIDPLTSVYRLDRNQNAELRCDLYQEATSHNTRLRLARSEAEAPFNWIRSFPRRPSTSSVHSGTDCTCGATNSTKAGCCGTAPVAGMRRFRSSHATCNSLAVRLIPSFRATSTAADQSSAGIRAFPLRLFLHSSKRAFASSRLIIAGLLLHGHGLPPRRIPERQNDLSSYRRNTSCSACRKLTLQCERLKVLSEQWQPEQIIAEQNSIGQPIIEQLTRDGLRIDSFTTTNASKAQVIDALALAFEREDIRILNDPVMIGELVAYQAERLPSGLLRYGAPSGHHDDTVMALAIAWSAVSSQHRIIYPMPDSTIVVKDFAIPDHWPRAYGLDIRWRTTAAIWGARDPESDVLYLYSEYFGEAESAVHVAAIRARGVWIPGLIDAQANGRSQVGWRRD